MLVLQRSIEPVSLLLRPGWLEKTELVQCQSRNRIVGPVGGSPWPAGVEREWKAKPGAVLEIRVAQQPGERIVAVEVEAQARCNRSVLTGDIVEYGALVQT